MCKFLSLQGLTDKHSSIATVHSAVEDNDIYFHRHLAEACMVFSCGYPPLQYLPRPLHCWYPRTYEVVCSSSTDHTGCCICKCSTWFYSLPPTLLERSISPTTQRISTRPPAHSKPCIQCHCHIATSYSPRKTVNHLFKQHTLSFPLSLKNQNIPC